MATKPKTPKATKSNKSNTPKNNAVAKSTDENQPILGQRGPVIQEYGTVRRIPLGLSADVRRDSADMLNQTLADTITLAHLYKKHHWQISGATFYQLHLLFDKHYQEQTALIDSVAERVQLLGGVATGMPTAVAKLTNIENPPDGIEEVPVQISRLLEAHELIMKQSRDFAGKADEAGDDGTNDLLVSEVLRVNELQSWFLATHLVDEPLIIASDE